MSLYEVRFMNRKGKKGKARTVQPLPDSQSYLLTPKSEFFIREAYKALRSNVSFSLADKEGSKE